MRTRRLVAAARSPRGLSAIYFVVLLVAVVAFVSMAVDIGRIRLARTELQADAAARSGADALPISTPATIDNAVTAADANGVIDQDHSNGTPDGARINPGVTLIPDDDIEFGIWDPTLHTFSVLVDNAGTVND